MQLTLTALTRIERDGKGRQSALHSLKLTPQEPNVPILEDIFRTLRSP